MVIHRGKLQLGYLHLWIQDIHASKDPIVQNILKEFEIRLEDSRKLGIKLAKDFSAKIKELSDQAKAEGKEASLNSIIDNDFVDEDFDENAENIVGEDL